MPMAEMFALDPRSLALYRVCIAVIVLLDLCVRGSDLQTFYSDSGVLPRFCSFFNDPHYAHLFSLYFIHGSAFYSGFLFVLTGLFSLCFLVGWHTKLFNVLLWILTSSLHTRQPLVLNGGDLLLRVALFWSIFLPLDHSFSLDAVRRHSHSPRQKTSSLGKSVFKYTGSIGWMIQFSSVYVFSFGLKSGFTWFEGTAVSAALQQEQFLTTFGYYMRSALFPSSFYSEGVGMAWFSDPWCLWILRWSTWGTLYFEFLIPFLFCCPIFTQEIRLLNICGIWIMHLMFGSNMRLGFFVFIPIACSFSFLPPLFWSSLTRSFFHIRTKCYSYNNLQGTVEPQHATILVSSSSTQRSLFWHLFIIFGAFPRVIQLKYSPYAMLPTESGLFFKLISRNDDDHHEVALTSTEQVKLLISYSPIYYPLYLLLALCPGVKEKILRVLVRFCSSLTWEHQFSSFFTFGSLFIYMLSPSRYSQGERSGKGKGNWIFWFLSCFLLSAIFLCLLWNVNELHEEPQWKNTITVVDWLRLDQWWGMFSPDPPLSYGWMVIPGRLETGEIVNLLPGHESPEKPPTREKPLPFISASYPNQRWRKYLMNLEDPENADYRVLLAQHLCDRWHESHSSSLFSVAILLETVQIIPDLSVPQPAPTENSLLKQYFCHTTQK